MKSSLMKIRSCWTSYYSRAFNKEIKALDYGKNGDFIMTGYDKKIMRPWRPVEAVENGCKDTVKVWGREYTMEKSALITSILSQGNEILTGPMRLVVEENGEEAVWEEKNNYLMKAEKTHAVICGVQKSNAFVFNTAVTIEYDGLVSVTLKVVPKGRTFEEVMGYAEESVCNYELEKLWIEIPLKREVAKMYQVSLVSSVNFVDESVTPDSVVSSTGNLASSMCMGFSPIVSLMNGEKGLSYFCESAENWQPEREDKAVEILVSEDEVLLRLHLLDSHPHSWKARGTAPLSNAYFPLTYKFGMMATPSKPGPENPYQRKILHLEGAVKGMEYDEYLSTPSDEFGGMNGYDRMKEMGVTTLILHEAWNTTQNFWEVPIGRQRVIKNIIHECHARNIEFVPYFGYEISTLGTYWDKETVNDIIRVPEDDEGWFGWYREPFQRDYVVCYRSQWRDALVKGVQELVDEFDIDGIYVDLGMSACQNEKHGCGYRDHEGKLHPTYPIYGIRELFRGLYSIFDPRGGMINSHQGSKYNIPSRSFIHANFTGEEIAWYIKDEGAEKIPLDYYHFTLDGRNCGTSVEFIVQEYPNWTFKDSMSVCLLCGALPRPRNFEQLELVNPVWKILDRYPIERASWYTYKESPEWIHISEADIKASFYSFTDARGKKSLLTFISNPTRRVYEDVKIDFSKLSGQITVYDALNKQEVEVTDNTITLSFDVFKLYILLVNE